MNVATFVGHVGKDAKLEKTQSGKAVASFSLAIDNGKDSNGQKRDPTWIKAVLWERKAEALTEHVTKGKQVAISGPVHVEAWIDLHNQAHAAIVCTVREFTFCGAAQPAANSKPGGGRIKIACPLGSRFFPRSSLTITRNGHTEIPGRPSARLPGLHLRSAHTVCPNHTRGRTSPCRFRSRLRAQNLPAAIEHLTTAITALQQAIERMSAGSIQLAN